MDSTTDSSEPQRVGEPSTDEPNKENSPEKSFVELTGVSRIFKAKHSTANEVVALRNVNLEIQSGERLALLGKSGSGKSTLLNLLGGLDRPTSGSIHVDQQDVTGLNSEELANYRLKSVGMIFQAFNLIPTKTAIQNVEMPFVFAGEGRTQRKAKAKESLMAVGLAERIFHRPAQLSGGEQQRVAIARAIANRPGLLLADEPTGNLDSSTAKEIMQQLVVFTETHNTAVILVTHDEELAFEFAHRIVRLRDGVVVESE